MPIEIFKKFIKMDAASGVLLMIATLIALVIANTPLAPLREAFINLPVEIRVGPLHLDKPLLLWINDGLMALFFFHVGLELKREFIEGELSEFNQVILPGIAAIGGIIVPALIYVLLNSTNPETLKGWAIPAATDIAFAVGVLSLFAKRVPSSLKIFLLSLAIFDDVGAIIIIALFYTSDLSFIAMAVAGGALVVLFLLNRFHVAYTSMYMIVGAVLWVAVLKSGVHATLAGVALAMFIPMYHPERKDYSPVKELEDNLHKTVSLIIIPLFAFANAGVPFINMTLDEIIHPVPLGVAAGLLLGKPIGVFLFSWLTIKSGLAERPTDSSWSQLFAIAVLCGIGFTMSLFVGSLAFNTSSTEFDERLGILIGSFGSAIIGYVLLAKTLPAKE